MMRSGWRQWKVRTGSDDVGSWALRGEAQPGSGSGDGGAEPVDSTQCVTVRVRQRRLNWASSGQGTEEGTQSRGDD